MSTDLTLELEIKARLCDRFSPGEFVELLEVTIEELVDEYFSRIPDWVIKKVVEE